jgi:hypothetical protein
MRVEHECNLKSPPIKPHWIDRCVDIYNFHVAQLKTERNWTIEKTAGALCRSVGSVSEDLLLASWLKTHEKQMRRFRAARDAIKFIRTKKHEMRTQELDI